MGAGETAEAGPTVDTDAPLIGPAVAVGDVTGGDMAGGGGGVGNEAGGEAIAGEDKGGEDTVANGVGIMVGLGPPVARACGRDAPASGSISQENLRRRSAAEIVDWGAADITSGATATVSSGGGDAALGSGSSGTAGGSVGFRIGPDVPASRPAGLEELDAVRLAGPESDLSFVSAQ